MFLHVILLHKDFCTYTHSSIVTSWETPTPALFFFYNSREKANIPGHSLWLLTATRWVRKEQPGVRCLNYHGDTRGCPINSLHGNGMLYFPAGRDRELWPAALLLQRALITPWTKPNHGGESSVDLWGMFEACAVFSLWNGWRSTNRLKSCQCDWILGCKCLVHFKTFWEIQLFTFFFFAES